MKAIPTFEEFLNESNTRFLNFKTKAQSAGFKIEWLDELDFIPDGVKEKAKLFGNTHTKDIAVIFDKTNDGNINKLKEFNYYKGKLL